VESAGIKRSSTELRTFPQTIPERSVSGTVWTWVFAVLGVILMLLGLVIVEESGIGGGIVVVAGVYCLTAAAFINLRLRR
jgi:hypothetical protein